MNLQPKLNRDHRLLTILLRLWQRRILYSYIKCRSSRQLAKLHGAIKTQRQMRNIPKCICNMFEWLLKRCLNFLLGTLKQRSWVSTLSQMSFFETEWLGTWELFDHKLHCRGFHSIASLEFKVTESVANKAVHTLIAT